MRDTEVSVPDLAGWRRERMPTLPDGHRFETVPDWVCEIGSPSTAAYDRGAKLDAYARFGVTHAWLVDLPSRTVEAFANEGERWRPVGTAQGNVPLRLPPFDAVAIEMPWA